METRERERGRVRVREREAVRETEGRALLSRLKAQRGCESQLCTIMREREEKNGGKEWSRRTLEGL